MLDRIHMFTQHKKEDALKKHNTILHDEVNSKKEDTKIS